MLANTRSEAIFSSHRSERRIEVALLISALFLQRFSLPFQRTFLMLDIVPVVFILAYQFFWGKLLIQLDRLFWYLATVFAVTLSLLLNFRSTMLTSFCLFVALYSLVILSRPSSPERYKETLQAFQSLVLFLSYVAVAQFVAQFVVDGRRLIMFYGMFPDVVFGPLHAGTMNTIHTIEGSSLLKSNGLFLAEPSNLSQVTALGILIEITEFRRLRYLFMMVLGFLTAYSGVGIMVLLLFLPLASVRNLKAGLSVVFVIMFALGLFVTGLVDSSVFLSRTGEFENLHGSGFARFVSPWWLLGMHLDTTTVQGFLIGSGPGTAKDLADVTRWWSANPSAWLKWLYEYGMIGLFIFVCFCACCLRRSRCPGLLLAALILIEVFAAGFLTTWFLTVVITLCTLQSAEPQRSRVDTVSRYPEPLPPLPVG
jgi:hypothetical protein